MGKYFNNFDFSNFWNNAQYSLEYMCEYPSDELVKSIESELGYKLPESYIELMKMHNGGMPFKYHFPIRNSSKHIEIEAILGIGRAKGDSLCGSFGGSKFWIEEWRYPNVGIYFCTTPTGGHDMVAFDYRKCGNNGQPEVVYVDQKLDYKITFLAKDFETFIKGLTTESVE